MGWDEMGLKICDEGASHEIMFHDIQSEGGIGVFNISSSDQELFKRASKERKKFSLIGSMEFLLETYVCTHSTWLLTTTVPFNVEINNVLCTFPNGDRALLFLAYIVENIAKHL